MSSVTDGLERQKRLLDAAVARGQVRSADPNERKSCIRLNAKGLLRRDRKDADLWFPTDKALADAPPPALPAVMPNAQGALGALIDGAADRFLQAKNAADILDAQMRAGFAYDAAKAAARMASAKGAHDDVIARVYRLQADALEIESMAKRRLADEYDAAQTRGDVQVRGGDRKSAEINVPGRNIDHKAPTAEDIGLTRKKIHEARQVRDAMEREAGIVRRVLDHILEAGDEPTKAKLNKVILGKAKEIRTEKMARSRAVKTALIESIAEAGRRGGEAMPRAAYAVGYCDFPWKQESWSDETGQDKGRPYPTMTVEEGVALCAGEKSPFTEDAVLYFWTTGNRMRDAFTIIEGWGFKHVTVQVWDKVHPGTGFWTIDQTEYLLIVKRGNFPGIDLETRKPPSLYSEAKQGHSRKPEWFAREIDRLFPSMRKLELFQRKDSLADGDVRRNGMWDFWGHESGSGE